MQVLMADFIEARFLRRRNHQIIVRAVDPALDLPGKAKQAKVNGVGAAQVVATRKSQVAIGVGQSFAHRAAQLTGFLLISAMDSAP